MSRIILMLLLAVVSSNAMAEWDKVARFDTKTIYIDHTTIRKSGYRVKIWALVDLKRAIVIGNKPFISWMTQVEFDCKQELMRQLAVDYHSDPMGIGEVVHSEASTDDKNWMPLPPNSIFEAPFKIACGKK
ncbi:MAG: surface-adhesin E family protein [Gallionella sp.]|jgi:hypothetical protein